MSMFIRVKRKKTTYFLHCEPSETVLEVKQMIQALSEQPADEQRLTLISTGQVLDDAKSLADQKVESDAVVALCFKLPELDAWEDVNIEVPDLPWGAADSES